MYRINQHHSTDTNMYTATTYVAKRGIIHGNLSYSPWVAMSHKSDFISFGFDQTAAGDQINLYTMYARSYVLRHADRCDISASV